jgi:type II secretory pathway component PulF
VKFAYRGYDKLGQPAAGTLESATIDAARDALRRQGLFVSTLKPAAAGEPGAEARRPILGGGARLRDLANLTRQLAVLVSSGTTVVDALTAVESQQADGPFKRTLSDVRRRVEEGAQLSDALAAHPDRFDPVCRALIAAGESRGNLGEMLQRLSTLTRGQLKIRSAVLGAMVYPALLTTISTSVLVTMLVFVLPRFEDMFNNLGAALPPSTQVLMSISGFLRHQWYVVILALAAGTGGTLYWLSTPAGRTGVQVAMTRLPPFGRVIKSIATARLARIMGVLLDGRVPLVDALALTKAAAGHVLYARLVARAEEAVTKGEPVSSAFADASLIHPSVYEALRSGERSGQVGSIMLSMADFLDEDNETILRSLTSVIEPLILVVMGVLIGLVATAMFLPLFDLTAAGGGMAPGGTPGSTGGVVP